ncbi:unnamed protein product [Closterium sp. Yama58-4]|nr:unnamed protein product [Closterium sp. Yama58-4]
MSRSKLLHVCHVTADWTEDNVLGHVAQFEEQMEMEMMNPAAIAAEAAASAATNLELLDLRYHQGLRCNTSAATCPAFSACASHRRQATPISACAPDPPLVDKEHVVSTPPLNHASDGAASSDGSSAGNGGAKAASGVPPYPYNLAAVQTQASFDEAVAEPFAAQVFLLENVFLNDRGAVFDATYYYRHGLFCRSCPLDTGMYTGGTTTVYRDTTRRIVGRSQLLQELYNVFPGDRIVLFRGNLPVLDAKRLFNRARLFISPHGALMTNMVFMPSQSHVVEVRPQAFDNNCYHFLAHICHHSYYLVHGNGTKNSDIHVDMEDLVRVVKGIAGKIST